MNILFITADQWRGECLSALGHAHAKTPNLDALAREGLLLEKVLLRVKSKDFTLSKFSRGTRSR